MLPSRFVREAFFDCNSQFFQAFQTGFQAQKGFAFQLERVGQEEFLPDVWAMSQAVEDKAFVGGVLVNDVQGAAAFGEEEYSEGLAKVVDFRGGGSGFKGCGDVLNGCVISKGLQTAGAVLCDGPGECGGFGGAGRASVLAVQVAIGGVWEWSVRRPMGAGGEMGMGGEAFLVRISACRVRGVR